MIGILTLNEQDVALVSQLRTVCQDLLVAGLAMFVGVSIFGF